MRVIESHKVAGSYALTIMMSIFRLLVVYWEGRLNVHNFIQDSLLQSQPKLPKKVALLWREKAVPAEIKLE